MKNIFILSILLFFTNCSAVTDALFPSFPDSNNFVNRFGGNKKGIIIFKLNSNYPATTWCKADLEKENTASNCFEINSSDYYQILMLEQGWYELRGYEKNTRIYQINILNPRFSNITKKRISKPILAFQIKEDKIIFAGKINYHNYNLLQKTSQEQDFEEIKDAFKNQNQSQLQKIFKGHKVEATILSKKLNKENIEKYFIRNLVKTANDFAEEKRLQQKAKKQELKNLKLKNKEEKKKNKADRKKAIDN